MKKIERDDTDYQHEYYEAGEVNTVITELEAQLSDAKQVARHETDVASQAIADFEAVKAQLAGAEAEVAALKQGLYRASLQNEAAQKDAACIDWMGRQDLFMGFITGAPNGSEYFVRGDSDSDIVYGKTLRDALYAAISQQTIPQPHIAGEAT